MLSYIRAALTRIGEVFRSRAHAAREQEEEFRFHVEMETGENIRRGMSRPEARRAALIRFGGQQRFHEETQEARGVVLVDNLARDIRFALRRIRRAPGFAAGVIATLGVGIGVAVGIGTIVYGVLLRDLPYPKSDQLVRVGFHTDGIPGQGELHSPPTFYHLAMSGSSFIELGSYSDDDNAFSITDADAPEHVSIARVTPNVLTLLGVRPLLGQLFEPRDTLQSSGGGSRAVLISEALWRRRYGADPAIIGRRVAINHGDRIIIGVLPRTFDFPSASTSVWYPQSTPLFGRPSIIGRYISVIGRLRDGIDISTAEARLNALVPSLAARFPSITPEILKQSAARVSVASLKSVTVAPVRPELVLLGILVAVVLLIATTNVVNLFLLRTERASQEIAIALSLGAPRVAIARRFVVEGIVLGLASSIIALPAAALAVSTKFGFSEREIPRLHEVAFTGGTVALLIACAAVIGAGVGLVALTRTAGTGLFDRIRASHATPSRAWRRAQNGLVALQVAIALALLVAAGLLGKSFWNLRNVDLGFDPANTMTAHVSLPWGYGTYEQTTAFHEKVMDRLAALPGVTDVAVVMHPPLTPGNEGQVDADDDGRPSVTTMSNTASPNYFRVMRIPLLEGRSFQPGDERGIPGVVVSERLATSVFGTIHAVGRTLREPSREGSRERLFAVVGVVGDVHGGRIEDGYTPMMYLPLLRGGGPLPEEGAGDEPRDVQYVIRGRPLPAASTLQRIVREVDPRVPATDIRTLGSIVDDATVRVRLTMLLIGVAAAAALLLGVIGVYSVVSYAAAGRVREFGIRLALGAAPRRVGGLVLVDALRLVAVGSAAGLVMALSATRFLRSLLYEVTPTSLTEFALATAVLVMATLSAAVLPARRAARTDPAQMLRED